MGPLANIKDPDEMLHYFAVFHKSLHCLPKLDINI